MPDEDQEQNKEDLDQFLKDEETCNVAEPELNQVPSGPIINVEGDQCSLKSSCLQSAQATKEDTPQDRRKKKHKTQIFTQMLDDQLPQIPQVKSKHQSQVSEPKSKQGSHVPEPDQMDSRPSEPTEAPSNFDSPQPQDQKMSDVRRALL